MADTGLGCGVRGRPVSAASGIVITMPKKLYIETVGCQMNVLDSELVVGGMRRQGYELTPTLADADLILFNTCSVRQHAEDKIYSALGRLRSLKHRHPERVVGVLGCMAQKDQERIRKRAPFVDIICGPGQLSQLPGLVADVIRSGEPQLAVSLGRADDSRPAVTSSFESYDPLREPLMRPTAFQAFVRTQFGCDKFCTYCIVPSVRGPEQSRSPDHILAEVRQLADQGCKEITLVGQTVNSYRYHLGDGRTRSLADLLSMIHDTAGIERIRFVTNFPKDMDDDLLDAVRDLPKVMKYLHVPAQSGCDDVLRRMKRLYTVSYYREMLQRCRERAPGVSISSDFIVGFCGESEESFQKSCDLVADAGFKNSFIFKYSARPGTKADDLYPDDIPEETKKRRNNDLLSIQNSMSLADHRRWIGATVEVLVEGASKKSLGHEVEPGGFPQLTGRSMTDHIVVFDGPARLAGHTVRVLIDDASAFTLFGIVETAELVGVECEHEPQTQERMANRVGLPLV